MEEERKNNANPFYAEWMIAKALKFASKNENGQIRQEALKRAEKWSIVFLKMMENAIKVGSRTPVSEFPPWVTLEVLTGGFTTGKPLAGGELQKHEVQLIKELGIEKTIDQPRFFLNQYYISEEGFNLLRKMLREKRYCLSVPEEGALLVVSWLVEAGYLDQARSILNEIVNFFPQLRFYPIPSESRVPSSLKVKRQNVEETISKLQKITDPLEIRIMTESLEIWHPFYFRAIDLFLETVKGDCPRYQKLDKKLCYNSKNKPIILGGWPCQKVPNGWYLKVKAYLEEFEQLKKEFGLCRYPFRIKSNLGASIHLLLKCANSIDTLTGREVGMMRTIMAQFITKYGTPTSQKNKIIYEKKLQQIPLPRKTVANILIQRLNNYPKSQGLESVEEVLSPFNEGEKNKYDLKGSSVIPSYFHSKIKLCLEGSLETLIEQDIINSLDILAVFIPLLTSRALFKNFPDNDLQYLISQIYQVFRSRRSLLLLNLEHQVQFDELPWVQLIEKLRLVKENHANDMFELFNYLCTLVVRHFPHLILPNKLLQELQALSNQTELNLPLVEELAADIFMGTFSGKFLSAAKKAAKILRGTLYECYYNIDFSEIEMFEPPTLSGYGVKTSLEFNQLCHKRANFSPHENMWSVSNNGKIIEQAQILTTHNLALLFDTLPIKENLGADFEQLPRRCFKWICKRGKIKPNNWRRKLKDRKNMAYAWRQMLFYLSLFSSEDLDGFEDWIRDYFNRQGFYFRDNFGQYFLGLLDTIRIHRDMGGKYKYEGEAYLGWVG